MILLVFILPLRAIDKLKYRENMRNKKCQLRLRHEYRIRLLDNQYKINRAKKKLQEILANRSTLNLDIVSDLLAKLNRLHYCSRQATFYTEIVEMMNSELIELDVVEQMKGRGLIQENDQPRPILKIDDKNYRDLCSDISTIFNN